MNPSNSINEDINLTERRIIKVQTVIDFEREPKIRFKALQIEEKIRDIFPQPAWVTPISDEEAQEIPRIIFDGAERCVISQMRIDYVVNVEKDKSKEIPNVLNETENKTVKIFNALYENTGKFITRMGIISHFLFPLSSGENSLKYLLQTFFKSNFTPENLSELDFHFVQQAQEKYNINWLFKAVRVLDDTGSEAILVLLDLNNYLEKTKKQIPTYKETVIKELFSYMNEITNTKLLSVVKNKFTLE